MSWSWPWLYPAALAVISVLVIALEALFPHRQTQRQLRPRLFSDALHLVFNGHFLGVILAGLAARFVLPTVDTWLAGAGLTDTVYRNAAAEWPVLAQVLVALVVVDFVQWSVHNLLHRVNLFWSFHKTHHSVQDGEMDWIVSFRFQWTEVVVYKTVLYLPLVFFGFGVEALMFHAIFGTFIGHLNHANLDWDWGPLKYLFNSPNMHIWHHDYDGDAKTTVNYGIIFSTWDWLFGTAHLPDHPPARLGFPGVETYPDTFLSQTVWPLQRWVPALKAQPVGASVLGALVLAGAWHLHADRPDAQPMATPMLGERAAASQPVVDVTAPASAYAADDAEREAALAAFGAAARAAGFAHPEHLVSVPELAKALGHPRLVLLDVRPEARFAAGHIPSARQLDRADYSVSAPIPGLSMDAPALAALLTRLGVGADSVVVAYTDGGPEHYRLWWTLKHVAGIDIRLLDGGLQQWKALGHGLAGGHHESTAAATPLAPGAAGQPSRWAEVAAFRAAHPAAALLDTRSAAEFAGEKQHRNAPRAGRIPGATHLRWWAIVRDADTDHRLAEPAALKALFSAHGVNDDTPVITYCQSGTRSAGPFFALHQLGRTALMNYDGSWAEYARSELPAQ